jgi:hypothetical protein
MRISKTWLTIVTALVLSMLSVGLILGRRHVLGPEIDGTPGDSVWKLTLTVEGEMTAPEARVTTVLPPDFRHQHIFDEAFESKELSHVLRTNREGGQRRAVWRRRQDVPGAQPFRLTYTVRCVLGMRRATPGMVQRTHSLDAAPAPEGREVKKAPLIECDHPEIGGLAARLQPPNQNEEGCVRALFNYTAELPTGPAVGALACLREESSSLAGRSRLLVALCRSLKIPARLVSGVLLTEGGSQALHYWAEVWVDGHWLPMDPSAGRFGAARFPTNYLVFSVSDDPVRGERARVQVTVSAADLHNSLAPEGGSPPTTARRLWRKMSLSQLRPEEQVWVKFLLLLPVGALVVCFFRTVIGINTYGTFGPALLGLVCRDLRDFPWALGIFVAIMLTGWGIRLVLDRYHLLLVPRISVVLTSIVILLLLGMMLLGPYAGATHGYLGLLPLVILTHMVERFWTVETEDGTAASFKTLLGTVVVAVVIALLVHVDILANGLLRLVHSDRVVPPDLVRTTLFRYPEALILVLAGQLLLGRYRGYRLTELFRFRDLLIEESPSGGPHELAGPGAASPGTGDPGDEPAQHRMHPRPQPERAFPTGGRQEADARPVPVDRGPHP